MEDQLSECVLRRLLSASTKKHTVGTVYPIKKQWDPNSGFNGFGILRKHLPAFNAAAGFVPHVILVDLDAYPCAPSLIRDWTRDLTLERDLILRVAQREVEAWIIGDGTGLATTLHLTRHCFPPNPERIKDPKRYIVRHAARSRVSDIRTDMVPPLKSEGETGPRFRAVLAAFVRDTWDLDEATLKCDSLRRARTAIEKL